MNGVDDGFDAIRSLRAIGNDIPIIILSGRTEDFDTLYGLDIGADDYITKPFNPVVLGAKIKALIRRNRKAAYSAHNYITAGPFRYSNMTLEFFKNDQLIPALLQGERDDEAVYQQWGASLQRSSSTSWCGAIPSWTRTPLWSISAT